MSTIGKKQIIDELAKQTNYSKKDCDLLLKTIIDIIKNHLINHDNVDLNLFGKFEIIDSKARIGYNPKNNEKIFIEASKKLKFKPSKSLIQNIKNK